jgi:hypothetical protein
VKGPVRGQIGSVEGVWPEKFAGGVGAEWVNSQYRRR